MTGNRCRRIINDTLLKLHDHLSSWNLFARRRRPRWTATDTQLTLLDQELSKYRLYFVYCFAGKRQTPNDFILPRSSPYGKTPLVERSHSKSLNDSTHCFNGTYSAACVSFGVIDCISLAASRPPHLDVSIQASWQRGSLLRLSAVSAKLQGSCFFCSSIFWLRQYCEKGEAGRWIRRATEGEEEKNKTSERTAVYLAGLPTNAQKAPLPNPL